MMKKVKIKNLKQNGKKTFLLFDLKFGCFLKFQKSMYTISNSSIKFLQPA